MAQPVAFLQDPEAQQGAGTFHFDDGRSVYALDPYLAGNLPAPPPPQQDERIAMNDPGLTPEIRAAMGAPAPPPVRSDGAPFNPSLSHGGPPPAANPESLPDKFVTTPVQPRQAAPAPPPAVAGPGQAGMGRIAMPEAPAAPQAPQPRWLPGSRGGVQATSKVIETEGQGAPYSQEDAQAREERNRAVVDAQTADFARQAAIAQRDGLRAGIEAAHYRDVADAKAAELAEKQQRYDQDRAHFDTEQAEFDKTARVDPQRWTHSKGVLGNIGLAVAQGLAFYGSAITHTSNPLQEMINGWIQNDIAAQEANIREGRRGQENALARLKNQYGDLEQAKVALGMIQQRAVDNEIKSLASMDQNKQVQSAAQMWLAQNAEKRQLEEQKFRDLSIGKRTEKTNLRVVPATGGRPETEEEMWRRKAKVAGYQADVAKSGAIVEAGGKDPNKQVGGVSTRLQGQIIAARNARDAIQETAATLGMKRDKHGQYEDPSLGSVVASKIPFSDTKQRLDAARLSVMSEIGKAQTGGVLTENEAHEIRNQLEGARTPGALGSVIRHYDQMMQHVEHNVRNVAATSATGDGGNEEHEGDIEAY